MLKKSTSKGLLPGEVVANDLVLIADASNPKPVAKF
jgi:hypothetical protein